MTSIEDLPGKMPPDFLIFPWPEDSKERALEVFRLHCLQNDNIRLGHLAPNIDDNLARWASVLQKIIR